MDTLLRSSRYTMGKALTSGLRHRQGPGNGSWVATCGIVHGESRIVVFIVSCRFDFSKAIRYQTLHRCHFSSRRRTNSVASYYFESSIETTSAIIDLLLWNICVNIRVNEKKSMRSKSFFDVGISNYVENPVG